MHVLVPCGRYLLILVGTTGSFRKNGKSNLHRKGVYFHKISIFATIPSLKFARIIDFSENQKTSPFFGDLVSRSPRLSKIAVNCAEVSLGDLP